MKYFEGQNWATGSRVDVQYFLDQEQKQLTNLQRFAADNRIRPSPLLPILEASSWLLGVATAVAPKRISLAVAGSSSVVALVLLSCFLFVDVSISK